MGAPGFWDNQEKAQQAVGELKSLRSLIKPIGAALGAAADLAGLIEMAEEDESLVGEVSGEIKRLEAVVEDLELKALLRSFSPT